MGSFLPPRKGLLLLAFLIAGMVSASAARAGDEDQAEEAKRAAQQAAPEDTAIPLDAQGPAPSVEAEPEVIAPDFQEVKPTVVKKKTKAAPAAIKPFNPDENVDYSQILSTIEESPRPKRGVLPPAQGFRGYRPSMLAIGVGDRTPGFGAIVEYSWNRLGIGALGSYLPTSKDTRAKSYGFFGVYGLYRWLPFDFSPYITLGVELGSQTEESFGGLTGGGVEAKIYSGITALLGWTYHSTVHRGYWGGAIGWSF